MSTPSDGTNCELSLVGKLGRFASHAAIWVGRSRNPTYRLETFISGKPQGMASSRWYALRSQFYSATGCLVVAFLIYLISAVGGAHFSSSSATPLTPISAPLLTSALKAVEIFAALVMSVSLAFVLASVTEFHVIFASLREREAIRKALSSLLGVPNDWLAGKTIAIALTAMNSRRGATTSTIGSISCQTSATDAFTNLTQQDLVEYCEKNALTENLDFAVDCDVEAYGTLAGLFMAAGLNPPRLVWAHNFVRLTGNKYEIEISSIPQKMGGNG